MRGRGGTAPLLGLSSLTLPTFARARNNRVAMHNTLRVSSVDFQTCRMIDSPKSAGREAALEVGLETCAAAGQAMKSYSKL